MNWGPGPNLCRTWPYANRLFGRLNKRYTFADHAVSTDILRPDEPMPAPKIAMLPEMRRRISGTYAGGSLKHELRIIDGEPTIQLATIRYELRDAFVYTNGLSILGRCFNRHGPFGDGAIRRKPIRRIPVAHYCMGTEAHRYFGHWLRNATVTALLAEDGAPYILHTPEIWPHCADYARRFELETSGSDIFFIDKLYAYQDFAQGSDRPARYDELRRRLRRSLPSPSIPGRRVFLKRGATGIRRLLVNEAAVEEWLATQGFETVDIAALDVEGIARSLLDAELVVSMEGSHLNHAHFMMRVGGAIVVLNPHDRFNATHFVVANSFGNRSANLVVHGDRTAGYEASLDELERTLALL